jgi:hypothetical protein
MSQKTLEKPRIKVANRRRSGSVVEGDLCSTTISRHVNCRVGPQGGLPDEREPCLQGNDDSASEGRLRDCGDTRDVAETKAKEATEMGRAWGYPLSFHDREGRVGFRRQQPNSTD